MNSQPSLKVEHLMNNAEFERAIYFLRRRRQFKSSNKTITNEELNAKFPKQKCFIKGCQSHFSYVGGLMYHFNFYHQHFCNKMIKESSNGAAYSKPIQMDNDDPEIIEITDEEMATTTTNENKSSILI
ncbi:uncharacterized protein LOC142644946 [Dermatophagoides pteronyssinus]|uniref:uncharacterized protein LOC142644946 n=1 Tax=Dermatophagoides pteronyssinus TaxID=6956 RepID=UPI003F670F33